MTRMRPVDRRRFLQIAGGAVAATALSSSVARAAAIAPAVRTRTIKDVEHIVVLMQENRSFDHYFGSLRGVRGFGDPHPAPQPSGQPVWNQARRAAVPPDRPRPGPAVHRGPRPRLEHHAPGAGRRRLRPVGAGQDQHHDGAPHPRRHPVPLRARGRVHDLRQLPLLAAHRHRPQPVLHVDRLRGQRRDRRLAGRPARCWTTPRRATTGRPTPSGCRRPGSRGRSTRTAATGLDAAGSWGWTDDAYIGNYGDNSLLYFDQYQDAAPGSPLYEKRPHRHQRRQRRHVLRHPQGGRARTARCRRSPGWSRPRRSASTRTGPPTTAPGTSRRSSTR